MKNETKTNSSKKKIMVYIRLLVKHGMIQIFVICTTKKIIMRYDRGIMTYANSKHNNSMLTIIIHQLVAVSYTYISNNNKLILNIHKHMFGVFAVYLQDSHVYKVRILMLFNWPTFKSSETGENNTAIQMIIYQQGPLNVRVPDIKKFSSTKTRSSFSKK